MVESAKNAALLALPPWWWADVIEVPLAITAAFFVLQLAVLRLQDLLPVAAYLATSHLRGADGAAGEGSGAAKPAPA
jgi:hypothetical protein